MRFGVFPAMMVVLASARAGAESASSSTPTTDRGVSEVTTEAAAAHEHFERALGLYRAGKYRRAVDELEAALAADPSGKDLVYNLALVQEKLGDFSGAISSLQRFQSMEKDPAEVERAAQTIERLQGARAELSGSAAPQPASSVPAPCPERPSPRGKFDGWVMGTGGLALASLLVGTVFGVRALSLDPSGQSTSASTSFATLHDRAERAHTAAIIADLAFSTSLLAGAAATTLYFGRYADPPPSARNALSLPSPRITAAWLEIRY